MNSARFAMICVHTQTHTGTVGGGGVIGNAGMRSLSVHSRKYDLLFSVVVVLILIMRSGLGD